MPRNQTADLRVVSAYKNQRADYQRFARYLENRFKRIARKLDIYPIITSRTKSIESFAEKIQREGKDYKAPLKEITDLCGVRIITHTLDEVDRMEEAIGKEFAVDEKNSDDKGEKLKFNEFGYLSKHFIIQLKEPSGGWTNKKLEGLKELKAELQLRTLAQHTWADIYHELGYKNEFQLPGRYKREFARLAALLESCDRGFGDIKDTIHGYEERPNTYMTDNQLRSLAARLETLLKVDRKNLRAAHRLIRCYLALEGDDRKIEAVLNNYGDVLRSHGPALRDIGIAYCRAYKQGSPKYALGQKMLRKAIKYDPKDVDALCSLAGTIKRQGDRKKALNYYREAHYIDPTHPYPLGNVIAEELLRKKNRKVLRHFVTAIEGAVERCKKQIEVQVNLPWAFFDLGKFHLYLDDPYSSFFFYAKGIETSPGAWMINSAHDTIESLIKESIDLKGLDILDKLLTVGWWMRASVSEKRKASNPLMPPPDNLPFGAGKQVTILAGGCKGLDSFYQDKLKALKGNLKDLTGVIVSGGTKLGVAALPGELQSSRAGANQLQTVGYLPSEQTPDLGPQLDNRYTHFRHTDKNEFSALEPLMFWEDFLALGLNPGSVKLIGFNGGQIAACEYRMALAFGACVGIVKGSGRAADELLADPHWKDHKRLHTLDASGDGVKKFLSLNSRQCTKRKRSAR
jgi:ppGpp synthetase/RelA/SpoT-type nucleotidyltranferase/Flp pilus assembly protein TadD